MQPAGTYSVALARLVKVNSVIVRGVSISTVTEVRLEQPLNAPSPMLETLLGMVTVVRPVQFRKAAFPIVVTGKFITL